MGEFRILFREGHKNEALFGNPALVICQAA
jgi:hypothetical protein